ncbi:MAG: DUF1499 domain-containing protein [Paracoccaceae bacterium]
MTKTGVRNLGLFIAFAIIGLLGLISFVRLAPTDAVRWHVAQTDGGWASVPWGAVQAETGGARLRLSAQTADPADLLARLDAIAMATPRTSRLAGSVAEGRITWETRSQIWGFPDYTTAEVQADGLYVHARLRFGSEDLGVNAKRLTAWMQAL